MDSAAWERLAAWWDDKPGDTGDLWHRALIDPTLLRVLGRVADQRVLDLACGNGYLARRLARQGARVTAVDHSAAVVDRARAREAREPLGIAYHVADAADLGVLAAEAFDVVVCNMGLMDIADAAGALQEAARVLRRGGRLVASLSHPCFDVDDTSSWLVERTWHGTVLWRKIGRYRELREVRVPWHVGPREVQHTAGYHRPLSWYFRALRAAGFLVGALEEPEPTEEFLAKDEQGRCIAQIPLHCVIEAFTLGDSVQP